MERAIIKYNKDLRRYELIVEGKRDAWVYEDHVSDAIELLAEMAKQRGLNVSFEWRGKSMGMQQKLDKARREGYEAGLKAQQPIIEMRGVVIGAQETWDIVENMIPQLEGIGPKTKEKILKAIQEYARKERAKYK